MKAKTVIMALFAIFSAASVSIAAEKVDFPSKIGAAKVSVEDTASKVGNYPQALLEIDRARAFVKKAEQSYDKGRQWMGLGGLKPESEQEVLHNLQMVEMYSSLANSRAAKGKNDDESAAIDKQMALLKSRVKVLEDRKLNDDRLRQDLQKCEAATKDMAALKTDKDNLSASLQQMTADRKRLEDQVADLNSQLSAMKNAAQPLNPLPAPTLAPVTTDVPPALKP